MIPVDESTYTVQVDVDMVWITGMHMQVIDGLPTVIASSVWYAQGKFCGLKHSSGSSLLCSYHFCHLIRAQRRRPTCRRAQLILFLLSLLGSQPEVVRHW